MSASSKSPLHNDALTLADLEVGMRIIVFSIYLGEQGEYEVQELPTSSNQGKVRLTFASTISGKLSSFYAGDIGLVPYYGDGNKSHWNDGNFTIISTKRDMLPELLYDSRYDIEDEYEPWG
ncbi:MAG: hypothetical protein WBP12_01840 [Candidatus Saccharimonas sp.]